MTTLRIFSMVFFLFSAVNGGAPVNMSYIKAPSDHQSTAWKKSTQCILWLMVKPHLSMPCPSEYLWSHVLNSATECVCHLTDIFTFSSFSNQSKVHFCNGTSFKSRFLSWFWSSLPFVRQWTLYKGQNRWASHGQLHQGECSLASSHGKWSPGETS